MVTVYIPPRLAFTDSAFCPHSVFMCFVWISEQTAIISLYSINWLVFITDTERVYCAVRTGSLYVTIETPVVTVYTTRFNIHNATFCPHSVYMCFVWIWEQTAIISLYSINWLVFITEMDCVYCAVRTGSLYITIETPVVTVCTTRFNIYNATSCPHSVYMCFVWIWKQTAFIFLYNINWLVFITETECVYCAVRTGSLSVIHVNTWLLRVDVCRHYFVNSWCVRFWHIEYIYNICSHFQTASW